jgi:hypothetical protein
MFRCGTEYQVGTFFGQTDGGLILAMGSFLGIGFLIVSFVPSPLIWFRVSERPQKPAVEQARPR